MGAAIEIKGLSKKFGEHEALKDLDLTVNDGEIYGILGPNGAGKTTTIKLITGLLRPTAGSVTIKGVDAIKHPGKVKKLFALLPDVPYLYEKLTGWEFMKFISRIYELEIDDIDAEIEKQLTIFNINTIAHDLIESYSHGLRQRLLLSSVMLRDPQIIILDEPMVGLDPEAARMVKDMFKDLARRRKTIFLSTHTLTDAQELCHKVAIINRGVLLDSGTIGELKQRTTAAAGGGDGSLEEIYLSITKDG